MTKEKMKEFKSVLDIDYVQQLKELLEEGFDVNSVDEDGNSCLFLACNESYSNPQRRTKIITLLIEQGANPVFSNSLSFMDVLHNRLYYNQRDKTFFADSFSNYSYLLHFKSDLYQEETQEYHYLPTALKAKILMRLVLNIKPELDFTEEKAQQIIDQHDGMIPDNVEGVRLNYHNTVSNLNMVVYNTFNYTYYHSDRKTAAQIFSEITSACFLDLTMKKYQENFIAHFLYTRVKGLGGNGEVKIVAVSQNETLVYPISRVVDVKLREILERLSLNPRFNSTFFVIPHSLEAIYARCDQACTEREDIEKTIKKYLNAPVIKLSELNGATIITCGLKDKHDPESEKLTFEEIHQCFAKLVALQEQPSLNTDCTRPMYPFATIKIANKSLVQLAESIKQFQMFKQEKLGATFRHA